MTTTTSTDSSITAAFDKVGARTHRSMDENAVVLSDDWLEPVCIWVQAVLVNDDSGVDLQLDTRYDGWQRARPAVVGKVVSFQVNHVTIEAPGVADTISLLDMVKAELLARGIVWDQYDRFWDQHAGTREAGVPYTLTSVVRVDRIWRP